MLNMYFFLKWTSPFYIHLRLCSVLNLCVFSTQSRRKYCTCAAVWVAFQSASRCQISARGAEQKLSLNKNAPGVQQTSSAVLQKTRRPYRTLRASLPPKQREKLSSARSDTALTHKLKCFFYSSSGFQHGVSLLRVGRSSDSCFVGLKGGKLFHHTFFFFLFFATWDFRTSCNTSRVRFIKSSDGL